MKKKLLFSIAALALLCGCAGQASLVQELAKDPATVHVQITSVWATIVYDRSNSLAVSTNR